MQHGADPSICDSDGLQCIHIAAQLGYAGIMAYFIAKGENMNCQDRGGMTPLMWSAYRVTRCAISRLFSHTLHYLSRVSNHGTSKLNKETFDHEKESIYGT